MTQGIPYTRGSGNSLAGETGVTLDATTVDLPLTKLMYGASGTESYVSASTPLPVGPVPAATGTPGKLISAASTNATSVKTSAGLLLSLQASNVNANPRYLKLYNKASSPTVGTDTPVNTFLIPGNTSGAGTNITLPINGKNFSTGIALAITGAAADSDTTAIGAGDVIVNYDYL